jgi:preprotein translocase subunit SecA
MKSEFEKVNHVFDRDIYWTRIIFSSEDMTERTVIFVGASSEYLEDYYKIPGNKEIEEKHFDDWIQRVVQKWGESRNDIFKQKIHYDTYANTSKGEANILDFILEKTKLR